MENSNQFISWTTQEIRKWIEDFTSSSLLTLSNANTYIQALQELENRKGDIIDN